MELAAWQLRHFASNNGRSRSSAPRSAAHPQSINVHVLLPFSVGHELQEGVGSSQLLSPEKCRI